ncbi:major tail protein [Clostridium perfringens]|uniref:Phage tail protein n=2 Tax=Clostridium perfringens TaxID=1502 RepID=A0AAP6WMN4_CLOPF|nr:major tail protein [Clostridium perfringens]NP_612840.1 major tail protein [Clostridium phage phi3626]AAL96781.1 major tail protein [Clostridium phage phi3626]EDT22879.1 major tail protein [Clostridium perfringens B str. ATCC 3626]NGU30603.1 phage tail protein [Clostridium perfringens]WEV05016.1 phage tail protein [Clostridium perfringens B]
MPEVVNTRRCGCKDIYIAIVNKNTATEYATATPIKLGRALNAKVTTKKTVESTESDDTIEETFESFDSIEIEFDVNKLSPEQKAILRGATYEDGFLINNVDDQAKEVAIGWRARQTNGKYEFVWYYCGKFNSGWDDQYETNGKKPKTQTDKMKGTFYGRQKDGNTSIEVDETFLLESHNDAKSSITNWFSKVQEKEAA